MRIAVSGGGPEPALSVSGYPGSLRMLRAPYILTTRDILSPAAVVSDCVLAEADEGHVMFYAFDFLQGRKGLQLARRGQASFAYAYCMCDGQLSRRR
jgi:hypothetical protein